MERRLGENPTSNTVGRVRAVLHHALKDAQSLGYVGRNVAASEKPPRLSPARDVKVWDAGETRAIIEAVPANRVSAMLVLFATTGMRRSEAGAVAEEGLAVKTTPVSTADKPSGLASGRRAGAYEACPAVSGSYLEIVLDRLGVHL